jgi:hypothetical protein
LKHVCKRLKILNNVMVLFGKINLNFGRKFNATT